MSPAQTDTPYAVVKTGGKQYRVREGQRLLVERLAVDEGKTVALEPVLYRAEEVVCDGDGLAKVKVTAKVIGHERGEKLRVFKFKPKRGYRRRTGHRQELTRIEVTGISLGAAKRAASKAKAADAEASAGAGEKPPAAAKPGAGEKPPAAAKPGAGEKPPAAAKPGAGEKPSAAAKPAAGGKAAAAPKPAAKAATAAPKAKPTAAKAPKEDGDGS